MALGIYGAKYSRMNQINLWKTAFKKLEEIWSASTNLLGPFLNTLFHMVMISIVIARRTVFSKTWPMFSEFLMFRQFNLRAFRQLR